MNEPRDIPGDESTTIRVPSTAMARAQELRGFLQQLPEYAAVGLTRAAVVRLALQAGFDALEKRRRAAR